MLRIEGATYRAEDLERIVRAYKNAAAAPDTAEAEFAKLPPVYAGYTLGALQFDGGSASAAKAEAAAAKGAAVVNEAAGTNEAKAAIEAAGPK